MYIVWSDVVQRFKTAGDYAANTGTPIHSIGDGVIIKKGYNILIPGARKKLLKKLDSVMLEHAKNMEFEEAAIVRDEIKNIKDQFSIL